MFCIKKKFLLLRNHYSHPILIRSEGWLLVQRVMSRILPESSQSGGKRKRDSDHQSTRRKDKLVAGSLLPSERQFEAHFACRNLTFSSGSSLPSLVSSASLNFHEIFYALASRHTHLVWSKRNNASFPRVSLSSTSGPPQFTMPCS